MSIKPREKSLESLRSIRSILVKSKHSLKNLEEKYEDFQLT